MVKGIIVVLIVLLIAYIVAMTKLVKSVDNIKLRLKEFSLVDFFKVFRGRVFEDNIGETFIALSILMTVAFLGVTYVLVWVLDLLV